MALIIADTVPMRTHTRKLYLFTGILLLTGIFFIVRQGEPDSSVAYDSLQENIKNVLPPLQPSVELGGVRIRAELATSSAAIQKGLSGRAALEADAGMLFIFPQADRYRFWMPDMHFPLDIIWIYNGIITDMDEDVSDTFDPAHPDFYSPSSPVHYVLEVNAGFARKHGLHIGDPVRFNNIK